MVLGHTLSMFESLVNSTVVLVDGEGESAMISGHVAHTQPQIRLGEVRMQRKTKRTYGICQMSARPGLVQRVKAVRVQFEARREVILVEGFVGLLSQALRQMDAQKRIRGHDGTTFVGMFDEFGKVLPSPATLLCI